MRLRQGTLPHATISTIGVILATTSCGQVAQAPNAYDPNAIIIDLLIDPEYPETGETITFTLSAHAVEKHLVSSSIDFDGDGAWDETRPNGGDDTAIDELYTHVYTTSATYTVRARVIDSSGTPAVRIKTLTVSGPQVRDVTAVAQATYAGPYNGGQTAGSCYAIGSPFTWPGNSLPIPSYALSLYVGTYQRGAVVGVAQEFGQDHSATTPSGDFPYACTFTITLHAMRSGQDAVFATASCGTRSGVDPDDPSRLCRVEATGEVP